MKHPDARMLATAKDPVARDNFQRLNRLFADGEFAMLWGDLALNVQHLAKPDLTMLLHWQKLGRLISLSIDTDLVTASKTDTSEPTCITPLPLFLRPRSQQLIPVPVADNGAHANGWLLINANGTMVWELVPEGAWTAGATAKIYATSVSYLGF